MPPPSPHPGKASFSVCALFYGAYPELAQRLLDSLLPSLAEPDLPVVDIRIGLNEACRLTSEIVTEFSSRAAADHGVPSTRWDCDVNACKYPLMRQMFWGLRRGPGAEPTHFMWFDDDSYLSGEPGWWSSVRERVEVTRADLLGKVYRYAIAGDQWEWVQSQDWADPEIGPPPTFRGRPSFTFATGGWWVARRRWLQQWDYPWPVLRHRGGDTLLGELCRHRGRPIVDYEYGVRINANSDGEHSSSPRRGVSTDLALGVNLETSRRRVSTDFLDSLRVSSTEVGDGS